MNRSKKLAVLLGILLAVSAAAFGAARWEERKEQIQNSGAVILEVPAESVQSLSWEYQSNILSFHRDGTWRYDGDGAFPVDREKVDGLLGQFQSFSAAFVIENVEDYGQYGLDAPVCTIRLEADGGAYEVKLGDYSKMDAQRYVDIGDGNVYLVKDDPLDYFDAGLSDMILHDEVPDFGQVNRIEFSGAADYGISYEKDGGGSYRDSDVYYASHGGNQVPLDTTRVTSYLNELGHLSLTNYVTYSATEEELQGYGLDRPELTVSVEYQDAGETARTFVLNLSRDPAERDGGEGGTATAYARVGDSPIVYQISSASCAALMAASYDDLRHREVLPADFADIAQLDIALEGQTYTLTSEKRGGARAFSYLGEELEIARLQNALVALSADSFTDEAPGQKQEVSLTVHLDQGGEPTVQIDLYRYDGAHCLAVVDGEPASLVDRSAVVDLIEAVHAIVLN